MHTPFSTFSQTAYERIVFAKIWEKIPCRALIVRKNYNENNKRNGGKSVTSLRFIISLTLEFIFLNNSVEKIMTKISRMQKNLLPNANSLFSFTQKNNYTYPLNHDCQQKIE